jgi:hypothetical protein
MIISPGSSHSFRINVVGYDVAVVRELALADCAYSVLFGNFPLRQFAHLGGRPQLPVSPWVVRVFDALHTHLYCCSAFVAGGFPATAITRSVDWTEFIAAEPHGLPLPGHFVKAVGLSENSEPENAASPSGCYNACPRGTMPNLTGVIWRLREGSRAGR